MVVVRRFSPHFNRTMYHVMFVVRFVDMFACHASSEFCATAAPITASILRANARFDASAFVLQVREVIPAS